MEAFIGTPKSSDGSQPEADKENLDGRLAAVAVLRCRAATARFDSGSSHSNARALANSTAGIRERADAGRAQHRPDNLKVCCRGLRTGAADPLLSLAD